MTVEIYIIPAHTKMLIFVLEKTPFPMDKKLDGPNPFQTQNAKKNSHFSQND